jgi:hypothetical protein
MTKRQSVLRRSSEVQARRDGCSAAWASATDGTTAATAVAAPEEKASEDFVLSVRGLLGNGAGSGADLFAAHWHGPPWEPSRSLQRQWHGPLPQQQHRCCVEETTLPPQQDR